MINPDIIRKNPEILKENIRRREINFDVEKLIELDNKRREFQIKIDNLRAELNKITDKIAEIVRSGESAEDLKQQAKQIREEIKYLEEQREKLEKEWKKNNPSLPEHSTSQHSR